MAKPPPRRVPSDDFVTTVDGIDYHPHEGEWIEIVGTLSVAEYQATIRMSLIGVELSATDDPREHLSLTERHFEAICAGLAHHIVDWSWTDPFGAPLPSPFNRPDVLQSLSPDELGYLIALVRDSESSARKNGSPPSPITSLVTGSRATAVKRSTTGRNRTRAS